jgi:hypothetical protein
MTSHEVRKPVANLLGLAEVAGDPTMNAAEMEELFKAIKFSAKELDDFTRKLIGFIQEIKSKHLNKE